VRDKRKWKCTALGGDPFAPHAQRPRTARAPAPSIPANLPVGCQGLACCNTPLAPDLHKASACCKVFGGPQARVLVLGTHAVHAISLVNEKDREHAVGIK